MSIYKSDLGRTLKRRKRIVHLILASFFPPFALREKIIKETSSEEKAISSWKGRSACLALAHSAPRNPVSQPL